MRAYENFDSAPITDSASWSLLKKNFHSQVIEGETGEIFDLLAALSHQIHWSLGWYCDDENHCHQSVLKELLAESGEKAETAFLLT